MDGEEEDEQVIAEEVEAMKSVYENDCTILNSIPPHFHLSLKPRTADVSSHQYPKEPPSVAIVDCKGLDQHRQKHLLNHIQTKANELSPGLMLVALCEEAVEKLSDMNHPDGDCPLCLFPLVTEEHQSETLPFMKLMSCFHCFHSECIIRWWNWLESSKQTGSSKSDNATARRNRGSQSEGDSNNTTIFVGGLDSEISDEDLRQPFLQYGDVVSVKIPIGKGCGFVQLADRKNAEEAIQGLNGTVIGKQTVRLSWGRSPGNKHWRNNDSNGNHYGGQGYGGHGYGGHGYAARQNQDIAMQQPAAAIQGAS
ncbi:Polyadenylate-binding protein rbp47b [Lathyrus oleraceus]|uniref:Polyadenylate-binding protein rbp47b n=1 Tax=Pisum sativum TaxID=3888 RepID=A0A9D4XTK6_PEA|nr:Polyadenylate-binding protein rbp47b [Pisum sativum]